jgi:hypothetical protein
MNHIVGDCSVSERLGVSFPLELSCVDSRLSHVGFVVEKWHWDRFPWNTPISLAISHSTDCCTFENHQYNLDIVSVAI